MSPPSVIDIDTALQRPGASEALRVAGAVAGGLAQQVERLGCGDHVCLIYDSFEHQMAALVPFIQEGFKRGERLAYIVDDQSAEDVARVLEAQGIDVAGAVARGAFVFLTKREVYLRSGLFDPGLMIEFLRRSEAAALAAGFTGLRIAGEMTWALGPEVGCERLIEYEAQLNRYFPGSRALAVCQYSRDRFPPEVIRDVLRTHPLAIIRGEVHENLFYEKPEMVLGQESAATRVDWMVAQLERVRAGERSLVEMSERLAAQAAENARLYQEAQQAVRLRDEFLSVASHELKTPLTPLQLKLQSLKREAQTHPGAVPVERMVRALEGAEAQVRRLDDLINDLLDVSRLTEGRLSLRLEAVDFADVLQDVVSRFSAEAARVGCALRVDAGHALVGQWDRQRLEQVVTNLLTNALKYGAGRPVRLALETLDGGAARLTVCDEGIGIAPESLERIFGKFERAVSERHYGGLGLGLYITRQLVQAMGGDVRVASELGRGSTFTVELPHTVESPALALASD